MTSVLIACSKTVKDNTIPLELVDERLIEEGNIKAEDILASFKSEKGAMYLLNTENITPKIHAGITTNRKMFAESYAYINIILESLSSLELYKVTNKPYFKRMFYKLKSSHEDIKSVQLVIDMNAEYKLAGYYLYAQDSKGLLQNENMLPVLSMK